MKYRKDDGREGLLTFGSYPEVSLEQARRKREEASSLSGYILQHIDYIANITMRNKKIYQ
jgi:hypothetical protein